MALGNIQGGKGGKRKYVAETVYAKPALKASATCNFCSNGGPLVEAGLLQQFPIF
jgi:hypothetical protein